MEQLHMEKKNSRSASVAKQGQDAVKPRGDYVSRKKNGQGKRKEYEKLENSKRAQTNRSWASQRNVRTREKVDSQVNFRYELNSVQRLGSKKQNISHLMPFDYGRSNHASYASHNHNNRCKSSTHSQSQYNKEHFLQANCQFVVPWGLDYSVYKKNPDQLIEWNLVEEVKLHSSVWPNCPICLYPPIAAKITKCGHIFCFPCILHYLALSDDKWRKCPICFDPIQKNFLKSVVFVNSRDYQIGEQIKFSLMVRDKDSVIAMPAESYCTDSDLMPSYFSSPIILNKFKLITATYDEISEMIIGRERQELIEQHIRDRDQPEICFTEQAMTLVEERSKELKLQSSLRQLRINENKYPIEYHQSYLPPGASAAVPIGSRGANNYDSRTDELMQKCMSVSSPDYLRKGVNTKERMDQKLSYFYQVSDGVHFYLNSLNVQMLKYEFGQIEYSPINVSGKIVGKETYFMTKELRQRYRYLQHLPLSCQFSIVEIEMTEPPLTLETLHYFQSQISNRAKIREKQKYAEMEIERRVQKEEDKMYGRTSSWHDVHFESLNEFPDFTHEPSLVEEQSLVNYSVPDRSIPSFAQTVQAHGNSIDEFPVLRSTRTSSSQSQCEKSSAFGSTRTNSGSSQSQSEKSYTLGSARNNSDNSPDEGECERAPQHNVDFAVLLDNAEKKANETNKKNGKKKKNKKGTVIRLTGGGM